MPYGGGLANGSDSAAAYAIVIWKFSPWWLMSSITTVVRAALANEHEGQSASSLLMQKLFDHPYYAATSLRIWILWMPGLKCFNLQELIVFA